MFVADELQRAIDRKDIISRHHNVTVFVEVTSEELVSESYDVKFGQPNGAREYNDVTMQPDQHNKSSDSSADYTYIDDASDNYVTSDVGNGDVIDDVGNNDKDEDSQIVMGDIKHVDDVVNYDGDNSELKMKIKNATGVDESYERGLKFMI